MTCGAHSKIQLKHSRKWITNSPQDENLLDPNLLTLVFVFLRSDSSDPEADDSDDQAAWDPVSSLQRRASLSSLKKRREAEEHSPKLRRLGVGGGTSSWPHAELCRVFFNLLFLPPVLVSPALKDRAKSWPINRTYSRRKLEEAMLVKVCYVAALMPSAGFICWQYPWI